MNTTARVYADGHCDVEAEGPTEYEDFIKAALQGSVRAKLSIDANRLYEILVGRRIPPNTARAIADSARVQNDDVYFTGRRPRV